MTKKELMSKPVLSAKTLESLTCVAKQEKWQEVFIFWLAQAARTMIEDFDFFISNKQHFFATASTAPENVRQIFEAALNELEQNAKEAIEGILRTFISENDVVNAIIKKKRIPTRLVKAMLGGKWPKHDFNFDAVDHFRVIKGTLVPDDGTDEPAPGPDLKLFMVNDPLKGPSKE